MGSKMYPLMENLPQDFDADRLEDAQRQLAWEQGLERARALDFTLPTQFAMAFFVAAVFCRDDRVKMWVIRNMPNSGALVGVASGEDTTRALCVGTLAHVLQQDWQGVLDTCEVLIDASDAEQWTVPYAREARARAEASLRDLVSAHQRGEEIVGSGHIHFASTPRPVIKWLNGLIISDPGLLDRLNAMSWDDADDRARRWHAESVDAGDASAAGGVA